MPFMIGREPIRRTTKYLEAGKLVLKNSIQVFLINYGYRGKNHDGIRLEKCNMNCKYFFYLFT